MDSWRDADKVNTENQGSPAPNYLDVLRSDKERDAKVSDLESDNARLRKINDILQGEVLQLQQEVRDLRNEK